MAILAAYPHARTLRVAVWDGLLCETATFPLSATCDEIIAKQIVPWLATFNITGQDLQFIVTNGRIKAESPSGIYVLTDAILDSGFSRALAAYFDLPVYVVDPTTEAECFPHALITGAPMIKRECAPDSFVFKYLVRQEANGRNWNLTEKQFIVAHLGEEHQLGAVVGMNVVDSLTSLDEGPFALNHSGGLPFDGVIDLCMSTEDRGWVLRVLNEEGGLYGYLGLKDVPALFANDSVQTASIREALVYQIAKEIGALATVLKGQVHAIILAGELGGYEPFVQEMRQRIGYLGPISVYPENQGLQALLAGAQRVLNQEPIRNLTQRSVLHGIRQSKAQSTGWTKAEYGSGLGSR